MRRLAGLWQRVDRSVTYVVLIMFFALQVVATFIEPLNAALNNGGSLVLIAGILLFVFRFIDERLGEMRAVGLAAHDRFADALQEVVGQQGAVDTARLFAHTGMKYYTFIRDTGVRIRRLQLLVCDPSWVPQSPFPRGNEEKESTIAEINHSVACWQRLHREGMIDTLEVRYFAFFPAFHFLIVGNEAGQFGLFSPRSDGTGVRLSTTFSLRSSGPATMALVGSLGTLFQTVFASARESGIHE